MKYKLKILVACLWVAIFSIASPVAAFAAKSTIKMLNYKLIDNGTAVEITSTKVDYKLTNNIRYLTIPDSVEVNGTNLPVKKISSLSIDRVPNNNIIIKHLIIPNTVEDLPYPFSKCTYLQSVTFGKSARSIGDVYTSAVLTRINIDKENPYISDRGCNGAFQGSNLLYGTLLTKIPADIHSIGYIRVGSNGVLIIPNTIDSVVYIRSAGAQVVFIPSSVKKFGSSMLQKGYSETGFNTLVICWNIDNGNLKADFKNLFISDNVTKLNGIISTAKTAEHIYCFNNTPPSISENTFAVSPSTVLHVPEQSVLDYFLDDNWSQFENIVGDAVKPESISLNVPDTIRLTVGQSVEITATITPDNTGLTPSFGNSNGYNPLGISSSTATSREYTATVPGETDLAVVVGDIYKKVHVIASGGISFNTHELLLKKGTTFLVGKNGVDNNADIYYTISSQDQKCHECYSTDYEIVGFRDANNYNGIGDYFVANEVGEANLVIRWGNSADTCHLIVYDEKLITVQFDKSQMTIKKNDVVNLTPSYTPNEATYEYVYENSDSSVVFYRKRDGYIQLAGLKPGKATLTATLAGIPEGVTVIPATCEVTVVGDFAQGDVNGDGVVSGADVTALYNKLLDGIDPAGDADVNGDGVVSGSDVTALYNLLLE